MTESSRMPVRGALARWLHKIGLGWKFRLFAWRTGNDPRYLNNIVSPDVRLRDTSLAGKNVIASGCFFQGKVSLGYGSTIGRGCTLHGGKISIGNYVQIAPHVSVFALNHPTSHLSIYVGQNLFGGRLKSLARSHEIRIGSDVWIGSQAVLLNSVTVGDGAIIGAGSVVVRDVPSYAIAVGNPARVVRKRFPDEIIDLLLQLQWWNWTPSELEAHEDVFQIDSAEDPQRFKASLEELRRTRASARREPEI